MLTEKDLQKLQPYLLKGKVINIEVKDRGWKGREVMLEYDSGDKYVGNLNDPQLHMSPVRGITSIANYFARGKYGNSSWRGNCSGLLIRDLIQFYKPNTFSDLAVGGGTSIDVAKDLGFDEKHTVFNDLNPKYGGIDISGDDMDFPHVDFSFWHPPYFRPSESCNMPAYSGKEWGTEINPHDGSRITDPEAFKKWFDKCNANLYNHLNPGGRLAILMGDTRFRGKYYSMFKNMDIYGELEQVIIKVQNNCVSDNQKYAGRFIPIQHEYLVILKKGSPYVVPVSHISFLQRDIRKSTKVTWATAISAELQDRGGKMNFTALQEIMEKHPKAENNHHVAEKLRQTINMHPKMFCRDGEMVCLAQCA